LRADIALGADLIAGFPTESAVMFENTLAFIDEAGLDYLHVFPFSARPGTPAARMPQVPGTIARERASRLREKGAAVLARSLSSRVGTTAAVLVERDGFGHSEHYAPVRITPAAGERTALCVPSPQWRGGQEEAAAPGDIVRVRVTGATAETLIGEPA
jgi:threonylcarbamoyladenosine tRNA methylthiotransferase MtaB